MSQWSSAKARRVLAVLLRIGWSVKRESSSHKILSRPGWSDVVFAFHNTHSFSPVLTNETRIAYNRIQLGFPLSNPGGLAGILPRISVTNIPIEAYLLRRANWAAFIESAFYREVMESRFAVCKDAICMDAAN